MCFLIHGLVDIVARDERSQGLALACVVVPSVFVFVGCRFV